MRALILHLRRKCQLVQFRTGFSYQRNKLYDTRWFQRFALAMGPSGLIALLAGWITTEVGRQPWVVYGVLRTADAIAAYESV
jgi:cytochrome bd ubiquinol oxidase subunit I